MKDNQFYQFRIDFSENTGEAEIRLYWSYTGQAKTLIPDEYLYYPSYVGASPIQVSVNWPTGYTGSDPTSPYKCIEVAGDGRRVGKEEWDDRNTKSGDGWDNIMFIETPWACDLGSVNSMDRWFLCTSGFEQRKDKRNCSIIEPSKDIIIYTSVFAFLLFLILKMTIASALIKGRYPQGVFFTVEQLQIFLLIPMMGVFYPEKLMIFFRLIRHSFLTFYLIEADYKMYDNQFHVETDLKMRFYDFQSGSAVVNLINWSLILLALLAIHFLFYFLFETLVFHKSRGFILEPLRKIVEWMMPGIYIKFINMSFVLLLLTSLNELQRYYYDRGDSWSWYFAFTIASLCSIFIVIWAIFVLIVIIKPGLKTNFWINEFFNGLRDKRIWFLYPLINLIYKLLAVVIVTIDLDLSADEKIGFFIAIETVFIFYLIAAFPFSDWKENFWRLMNDWYFFIYVLPLFHYYEPLIWTTSFTWVYLGFIMGNVFTSAINYICKNDNNCRLLFHQNNQRKVANSKVTILNNL
jgi:cysteine-rich repeat protein